MGKRTARIPFVKPDPCPYCGGFDARLADCDAESRTFELEYCCDLSMWEWEAELRHIPRANWKYFFRTHYGIDIRSVTEGPDGELYLDWGLAIQPISRKEAQAFVNRHHRHNRASVGDRLRLCAMNGPDMVAVCIAGRPEARPNPQYSVLEVTRLCVRDDLMLPALKANAASQLYSEVARRAKKMEGVERVITYTLVSEEGTSLKAIGWTPLYVTTERPKGWDCPSRPRDSSRTPNEAKVVWETRLCEGLSDLNGTARRWRVEGRKPLFGAALRQSFEAQRSFLWAA